jgi:glycosyltransferase involved in cell wall biosynthesis
MKGISVIICCYNSSARLYETLKHLALQQTKLSAWEIIIVDNASTDDTKTVAKETWCSFKRQDAAFKIVDEKKQGLSFARQRGVMEAAYEYLVFCDDDNWVCENYLQTAFELMDSIPGIGALGGEGVAVPEIEFPVWWDQYKEGYAIGQQKTESGFINDRIFIWGAGMVTRRSVLQRIYNSRYPLLLTDRKGMNLSSGGDAEICARILLMGYSLYYDDRLLFKHFIPKERLSDVYVEKLYKGHYESQYVLQLYTDMIDIGNRTLKQKTVELFQSIYYLLLIGFKISKKDKNTFLNKLYADWGYSFIPVSQPCRTIADFKRHIGKNLFRKEVVSV